MRGASFELEQILLNKALNFNYIGQ